MSETKLAKSSQEWVVPPRAKPGRKPAQVLGTAATSQRAARDRKNETIARLEARVRQLEQGDGERAATYQRIAKSLRDAVQSLTDENARLRRLLAAQGIADAATPGSDATPPQAVEGRAASYFADSPPVEPVVEPAIDASPPDGSVSPGWKRYLDLEPADDAAAPAAPAVPISRKRPRLGLPPVWAVEPAPTTCETQDDDQRAWCATCRADPRAKAFCTALTKSVSIRRTTSAAPAPVERTAAPTSSSREEPLACGEAWQKIRQHPNAAFADLQMLADVVAQADDAPAASADATARQPSEAGLQRALAMLDSDAFSRQAA